MATYTQADLDAIRAAILARARGEQITSLTLGDHSEDYAEATLDELHRLYAIVQADVQSAAGTRRPRQYVAVASRRL
jgi:hypothetical protein